MLGKSGLKIARAREEVLEILRSSNACSEWFAAKDATPATTFETLSFEVDSQGRHDIFESRKGSFLIFRQPYVARAQQDGGAYSVVTVNAHGAFYRAQGSVEKVELEGGPMLLDGTRFLTVGPYWGDSPAARIVTLLHEFGHIVNLLPQDSDDLDGSSIRNTNEVLRHCKAEVDATARQEKQMAKR